jgi:hypothetical protein
VAVSFLDPRVWLAIALACALSYGGGRFQQWRSDLNAQARVDLEATREAIRINEKRTSIVTGALNEYRKKLANAPSRTELDRLRNAIASLPQPNADTCGADGERIRVLQDLLGRSGELLQRSRETVTRLDAKTDALQTAISGVQLK